ncbi:MAG: phosphoenolpyruvate--protein phosphotransferase [Bradymonadales bacterium]|nr:phosphoenolpyruvate--protein phosphotransferase [Bradymonadales bacterium]
MINQMLTVRGIGASPGIVIGQVHLLGRQEWQIPRRSIEPDQIEEELDRFDLAIQASLQQIQSTLDRLGQAGDEGILIIESHRMMLQDEMLVERTHDLIKNSLLGAEDALDQTLATLSQAFSQLTVRYFRERVADLRSVGNLVMRNLLGQIESPLHLVPPGSIVVAHELSAPQAAELTLKQIKALVTEVGGITCHTAIMARAMEIPAVVGVTGICMVATNGQQLAVDGRLGQVILNPDQETCRHLHQQRDRQIAELAKLTSRSQQAAVTRDGVTIRVEGNIEYLEEIENLRSRGGTGIGLFRTEYLLLSGSAINDENSQVELYRQVLQRSAPHRATLRTLDMGRDKTLEGVRLDTAAENPALGLRGIRLSLLETQTFKLQLRALLRASTHGKMRLIIPFVTSLKEVREAKTLLAQVKEELRRENHPFDESIPFGIMIEIPSAAITADILAAEVDFFSIGTNDLVQYTLGVDRNNQMVASLYQELHPAVLRTLRQVVQAAVQAEIEVAICGEMAGEPQNIPLLLGCGLTCLSMNPISIPQVKETIRLCNMVDCKRFFDELLRCETTSEITARVRDYHRALLATGAGD